MFLITILQIQMEFWEKVYIKLLTDLDGTKTTPVWWTKETSLQS